MKKTVLFILFSAIVASFAQQGRPDFERLKAYSYKSDEYRLGFFFTEDTILLSYPTAGTYGDEKQISLNQSSNNESNNYSTYSTFEFFGEMGFVNDKKYIIERDSVNRIFTDIALQYKLPSKKWDTLSCTKNYYNENQTIGHNEFYGFQSGQFKLISKKFYKYDFQNRLIKDSTAKVVQNVMSPDLVRQYDYDIHNNLSFDSLTKYTNNIGLLESSNYYKYDTSFLLEAKRLSKNGLIQVWQHYKDSIMARDYTYLVKVNNDTNALNEQLSFFDQYGNPIEGMSINLANNSNDTSGHYLNEYTYDKQFNILSIVGKGHDQFGNWVNSSKREYIYDNENRIIDNAFFYWTRAKNIWRMESRMTSAYAFDSKKIWQKTYSSEDSVTWLPKSMTTYTYTEFNNPSQILNHVWDTMINDYFPVFAENYYWEKYFYDGNIIDRTDDLPTAIYPNPSDNFFNVIFESETDGKANVSIYNSVGETIMKKTISVKPQMNQFTWDASAFPVGMYIMVLEADSKQKSLKLLKTR